MFKDAFWGLVWVGKKWGLFVVGSERRRLWLGPLLVVIGGMIEDNFLWIRIFNMVEYFMEEMAAAAPSRFGRGKV